jgi:hypothetical protein
MNEEFEEEDVWRESAYGLYLHREDYDLGPDGDNWSYIDLNTLTIVSYRAENGRDSLDKPFVVAGPFPSAKAVKAAWMVLYGRY